jgi:hypothetical protein
MQQLRRLTEKFSTHLNWVVCQRLYGKTLQQ